MEVWRSHWKAEMVFLMWSIIHIFSVVVKTKVFLGKQFYHCHFSHLTPDDDVEVPQSGTQTQLNLDEDIFC